MLSLSKETTQVLHRTLKCLNQVNVDLMSLKWSYTTNNRRVEEISEYMKTSLSEFINNCDCYSLAIDETSDHNISTICLLAKFKKRILFHRKTDRCMLLQ